MHMLFHSIALDEVVEYTRIGKFEADLRDDSLSPNVILPKTICLFQAAWPTCRFRGQSGKLFVFSNSSLSGRPLVTARGQIVQLSKINIIA